jgi:hypothetical protein
MCWTVQQLHNLIALVEHRGAVLYGTAGSQKTCLAFIAGQLYHLDFDPPPANNPGLSERLVQPPGQEEEAAKVGGGGGQLWRLRHAWTVWVRAQEHPQAAFKGLVIPCMAIWQRQTSHS